jgi:hypothetical protein
MLPSAARSAAQTQTQTQTHALVRDLLGPGADMRATAPALLLALVTGSSPARAYVRATSNGLPHHWNRSPIAFTLHLDQLPQGLSPEMVEAAARGAAAAWDGQLVGCTSLELRMQVALGAARPTELDGVNRILFQSGPWCTRLPRAARPCAPNDLAATSVTTRTHSGEILDADIEINAGGHRWADLARPVSQPELRYDLQSVLAHEIGHALGLGHPCTLDGHPSPARDHLGRALAACDRSPPELAETTMFPVGFPGDLRRRSLATDDVQAICAIYPRTDDGPYSATAGGCRASARPIRPTLGWPVALGLALLARWLRRRQRAADGKTLLRR